MRTDESTRTHSTQDHDAHTNTHTQNSSFLSLGIFISHDFTRKCTHKTNNNKYSEIRKQQPDQYGANPSSALSCQLTQKFNFSNRLLLTWDKERLTQLATFKTVWKGEKPSLAIAWVGRVCAVFIIRRVSPLKRSLHFFCHFFFLRACALDALDALYVLQFLYFCLHLNFLMRNDDARFGLCVCLFVSLVFRSNLNKWCCAWLCVCLICECDSAQWRHISVVLVAFCTWIVSMETAKAWLRSNIYRNIYRNPAKHTHTQNR